MYLPIPLFIEVTLLDKGRKSFIRADDILEMSREEGGGPEGTPAHTVLYHNHDRNEGSPPWTRCRVKDTPEEIQRLIQSKALDWATRLEKHTAIERKLVNEHH